MLNVILKHAVEGGASDIHIEPISEGTRVRYRIDGELHTSIILPPYVHSAIIARIKVLSNMKLDETRIPQDGRFRTTLEGRTIDLRVSTLPLMNHEKVVMRILDLSDNALNLEKLGFIGRDLTILNKSVERSKGLILVTGPTGSGKSTTLYSLLTLINKEGVNIVTLEDPIEYYIEGVNQSQVNPEVGMTFASGLRAILRQDPDVVMVGEIRDSETAELAVHASLTGHIVFATLHTNDAFGAIPRLFDMKIEPFLLSSSLALVEAQRLVRRICSYCKEQITIPNDLLEQMRSELSNVPDDLWPTDIPRNTTTFYHGKGCTRCGGVGYKGRLVIDEVLEVDSVIEQLMVNGFPSDKVQAQARSQGMLLIRQDGFLKAIRGLTTIEEVLRTTQD
jgi:type IV pilus assembly protein PilB